MRRRNVLSAALYLRRNPGRSLPVAAVIVISVALVATIVTIVNSIDLSVLTMYGYQRHFAVVTPRNALQVRDDIRAGIMGRRDVGPVFTARPAFTVVKTVFGKMPFVIFGVSAAARKEIAARCGLRLRSGRYPAEGQPEIAMSEDIARNRGLRLGDVVLRPDSEDSYSLVPARLVGTITGPVWIALTSEAFVRDTFAVAPEGIIVMASAPGRQRALDSALDRSIDRTYARVWTYAQILRETHDALSSLYLILGIVVAIVVLSIAFLTGMLANIYFTQRLPEFATLAAIGYRQGFLLRRVLAETAALCGAGWIAGAAFSAGFLCALKAIVMTPRGLLLDPFDAAAYRATIPIPLAIAAFAAGAIWLRLRRFDPVTIIERRQ